VVVDSKSGAGGWVGTAVAARAPADGYTLLLGDTGLAYAPVIYPRAGFGSAATSPPSARLPAPYVLAINPAKLGVTTLAASSRRRGQAERDRHRFGGSRDGDHLPIGLFERGPAWFRPCVRGGAPMRDLLAGQIAAASVLVGPIAELVRSGKLRALAGGDRRREAVLPEVPTMQGQSRRFPRHHRFGSASQGHAAAILDRLHGAVRGRWARKRSAHLVEQGARVELEPR
jgi:tripartite-type tricarboxylate transporter receptor subunit TctC